ncbi:MAG: NAD-dependent epimerase/dehydratase family protein, partial [Fervidobacterium sp.]
LDKKEPSYNANFISADVTSTEELSKINNTYDAILHLAGIPHPLTEPPEKVFTVNTVGTFNLMQFAAERKIKKVILASSESTLGFAFAKHSHEPLYFPIDEQHPLQPQDPYGLSKVCAEEILKTYNRAYGIQTIALRFPWIWVPEKKEIEFYHQLVHEYQKWHRNLWAWVHVYDVVHAFQKALDLKSNENYRFFITADENWTGISSMKLIEEFYKSSKLVRRLEDKQSLISSDLAKVVLKYSPKYRVEDILK